MAIVKQDIHLQKTTVLTELYSVVFRSSRKSPFLWAEKLAWHERLKRRNVKVLIPVGCLASGIFGNHFSLPLSAGGVLLFCHSFSSSVYCSCLSWSVLSFGKSSCNFCLFSSWGLGWNNVCVEDQDHFSVITDLIVMDTHYSCLSFFFHTKKLLSPWQWCYLWLLAFVFNWQTI